MAVTVTAGLATELFIARPASTWPEFRRSGWLDPHAFGIANALDSGFTHLSDARSPRSWSAAWEPCWASGRRLAKRAQPHNATGQQSQESAVAACNFHVIS